ncbi:hypothetical protein GOP47_0004382 [Adiantum capillus-veneris]|uniref:Uncharacterized protein n=1 Tax=Adiantum capillus-veneris TaxID=13818 RepID=A0A9D4V800_ADICA|nr:hypothetical protein GOP47_0004382 [Adiantum capillus-veneris]
MLMTHQVEDRVKGGEVRVKSRLLNLKAFHVCSSRHGSSKDGPIQREFVAECHGGCLLNVMVDDALTMAYGPGSSQWWVASVL